MYQCRIFLENWIIEQQPYCILIQENKIGQIYHIYMKIVCSYLKKSFLHEMKTNLLLCGYKKLTHKDGSGSGSGRVSAGF